MANYIYEQFEKGTYNRLDPENIPKDAAKSSSNWLTVNGSIELVRGQTVLGDESTTAGICKKVHTAYRVNGTTIDYRQTGTKIQYLNGSTWTDVATIGANDTFTFQNYSNIYGSFLYIAGPERILEINMANPGTAITRLAPTAADRWKLGYILIEKGRAYRWKVPTDSTGLYLSWVDQAYKNGTTTTNQVLFTGNGSTTTFTGTIVVTAGSVLQGLIFDTNPATNAYTTDLNGNITGTGITGTINYVTGAYSITFTAALANLTQFRASYVMVNTAFKGILDHTQSTVRVAFEGLTLRQDVGGDPINQVVVGIEGSIFSFKTNNTYRYIEDKADLAPDNNLYRKDLGSSSLYGALPTSNGIFMMNTTNTDYPELMLLEKNPIGENVITNAKITQYDYSLYDYGIMVMETWDRFILISCRSDKTLAYNDTIIMIDYLKEKVDVVKVDTLHIFKNRNLLYVTSPYSDNVYKMFDGFDIGGGTIANEWVGRDEKYDQESLKKLKKLQVRGKMMTSQALEVYLSTDNQNYILIGTILGTGSYVDAGTPALVGSSGVGSEVIGGGISTTNVFRYMAELKVKIAKYRYRTLRFKAIGLGYISVDFVMDKDIIGFEDRLPKKYRTKQNVTLNGATTNIAPPQW